MPAVAGRRVACISHLGNLKPSVIGSTYKRTSQPISFLLPSGMLQQRQLSQLDALKEKKKKRLISRKCWKNHSLPASRTAGVDPVSALVTSAVPASHPVTCSQCKYQHKAATAAAAAAPGVYIHCCSRLSLHPSSPSSSLLLLLHASPIPPPASLQPRAATAAA